MKVALLFSGHLRSFQKCLPFMQENLLNTLEPDCFMFTWTQMGINKFIDVHLTTSNIYPMLGLINSVLKPKAMESQKQQVLNADRYKAKLIDKRSPSGVLTMFYSIFKANEIFKKYCKDNNCEYDVVIRLRPDLKFKSPITKEHLSVINDNNSIYIPSFGNYSGINDQFAIGTPEAMDKYSKTFINFDRLTNQTEFLPESLLKQNCINERLEINQVDFIKYSILRVNGEEIVQT